jgi:predicted DNA-binding protein (MmcQ/YjbR family)
VNAASLRRMCEALPGTEVDIKWGADVCYCVGKKMYAVTGPKGDGVSLKVEPELFELLTSRKGVVPAPYMAKHFWVAIDDDADVSEQELAALLKKSHSLVAAKLPKKLRVSLGIEAGAAPSKKRAARPAKKRRGS